MEEALSEQKKANDKIKKPSVPKIAKPRVGPR
jgi:hypothetical protein